MKSPILLSLAVFALNPLQAQVFRPEAVRGALLGSIAGAVVGHNSGDLHHNAWKGAAIGAGAGLLLGNSGGGTTYGPGAYPNGGAYIYRDRPGAYVGYRTGFRGHGNYGGGYYGGYVGYSPYLDYSYSPAYGYYGYGSSASDGLWLGALAGGIIGHNSGSFRHDSWRGAAWGAGIGWLLGSIADANRRTAVYEQPAAVVQAPPVVQTPAVPQPVTIINNYYGNSSGSMTAANNLFGRN